MTFHQILVDCSAKFRSVRCTTPLTITETSDAYLTIEADAYNKSQIDTSLGLKSDKTEVPQAITDIIGVAPAALNTLSELANALNNDASYATTITNALTAKAPLASPTFTGTVGGITKAMVNLGNVDNTTELLKTIYTTTQTDLNLIAPLLSPTFTGTVSGFIEAMVNLANVDNTTDLLKPISSATQTDLNFKAPEPAQHLQERFLDLQRKCLV